MASMGSVRDCPIFPTEFKILTMQVFRWVGGPELMHSLGLCRYENLLVFKIVYFTSYFN